uniref:class I SAM-dependent methyltransferase n=1 Tax=Oscillatoria sp. FACHB-1407 TaxID=2692847 RepID=UPI0030DA734B
MVVRQPELDQSHPLLCKAIAEIIAQRPRHRIPFAEFMDLALYHPQYGYYATNQVNIGGEGDFFTSPHLGVDFGELLAEQFVDLWHLLDRPHPFTLLEMGAGQGLLVRDILRYLHRHHFECFDAIAYIIVEKSPALVVEQQQRYHKLVQAYGNLSWSTLDEIPSNSIVGCCFSNELVDAFPVHQVVVQAGKLCEIYVTTDAQSESLRFVEVVDALSTPRLAEYFEFVDVPLLSQPNAEGYRTEVNLAALDWVGAIANRLHRGYVLTIDYGYPAMRYYSPGRSQGTLQCYYQHTHHSDPYIHIGRQDITAHVDFTALERQGDRCGLQTVGFTQQGLFLMALGLGDRLAALSDPVKTENQSVNDILRRREALHSLMNPMGLGNFGVLLQSKGMDAQTPVPKGFQMPGMR